MVFKMRVQGPAAPGEPVLTDMFQSEVSVHYVAMTSSSSSVLEQAELWILMLPGHPSAQDSL